MDTLPMMDDLPVSQGPTHAETVKNMLAVCTERQVEEFYRVWATSSVGKLAITKIVKTVKEHGAAGVLLSSSSSSSSSNTLASSPMKNLLMSPVKGSPLSPQGRFGYTSNDNNTVSPPASPRTGGFNTNNNNNQNSSSSSSHYHPALGRSMSESLSPRHFGLAAAAATLGGGGGGGGGVSPGAGAGADDVHPSALLDGFGTSTNTSSTTNNSPRFLSSSGGGSPSNNSNNGVTNISGNMRRSTSSSGASPLSPSASSSSSTNAGAASSPGIAIRVSPGAAVNTTSTGGGGGTPSSSSSSLRFNRSLSSLDAFGSSSSYTGTVTSPIKSPINTTTAPLGSGFDPDVDDGAVGFVPSSSSSNAINNTTALAPLSSSATSPSSAAAGSNSLPLSPRLIRSVSAPPLTGALSSGSSSGSLSQQSYHQQQQPASAVSSPGSSPTMSAASSPSGSPRSSSPLSSSAAINPKLLAVTGGVHVHAHSAATAAAASVSLSVAATGEMVLLDDTNTNSSSAGTSPIKGLSSDSKFAESPSIGEDGKQNSAEKRRQQAEGIAGLGHHHAHALHHQGGGIIDENNTSAISTVSSISSSNEVRDLGAMLAAVALSTTTSSAPTAVLLTEQEEERKRADELGITKNKNNNEAAHLLPQQQQQAPPKERQAPSIPVFYAKEKGGALSLGLTRRVAPSPFPAPIIDQPPMPNNRRFAEVVPQPPPRGKPIRSVPGQSLEEMLPAILDLFRKMNCNGPPPPNPLNNKFVNTTAAKSMTATTTGRGRSDSNGSAKGVNNKATGGGLSSAKQPLSNTTTKANGRRLSSGSNNSNTTGTINKKGGGVNTTNDTDDTAVSDDENNYGEAGGESTYYPPPKVTVATSGVSLSWEDAHCAVPVDHFAAIAKPLCGFPSFFAAPLFRRIKATYGGGTANTKYSNNNGGKPLVSSQWINEAVSSCQRVIQATTTTSASANTNTAAADVTGRAPSVGKGRAAGVPSAVTMTTTTAGRPRSGSNDSTSSSASKNGTKASSVSASIAEVVANFTPSPISYSLTPNPYSEDEITNRDSSGSISLPQFLAFWRAEIEAFDGMDRFFRLVKQRGHEDGIHGSDFMPFLEELLAYHPGLAFLEGTPEFQDKYARTVIARIFYVCDMTSKKCIDCRSLRASTVVNAFHTVDVEEDINLVLEYFSYEHFYVLYCKFWELDTDHDFQLTRGDLARLHHLTPCVLDRIFARTGRPFTSSLPGKMGYEDFCVFFLASEDKTTESALRYWFNVCDIDGDGILTSKDLKYFYEDQARRMHDRGLEVVKFEDILCQLHDLLKPNREGFIHLSDFINPDRIKLTGVLFNALFDLDKFQRFEGREGVYVKQTENYKQGQWERYAALEYQRLASEEDDAHDMVVVGGVGAASNIGGWGP